MEKIEHIRTLKTDTKSVLLIFRVKYDCCLSDYKLVFENDNNIILPQVKVTKGDFIWVTDMDSEEVLKRLKEYYPKYEKNINIYPDIIKEIDLAIDRAKKIEKYQIDNNRRIGTVEANPNTEVYKIVEYLMKKG